MYDIASALMKSLRGSDPDAALHYLARFLEAGDLVTPCRRLLCSASEDVGLLRRHGLELENRAPAEKGPVDIKIGVLPSTASTPPPPPSRT